MGFLLKNFRIENKVSISVIFFFFLGLVGGSFVALVEVCSISVFLKSVDTVFFPSTFLFASIAGMIASHAYTQLQKWISLSVLATSSLLILCLGNMVFFYGSVFFSTHDLGYIAVLFSSINSVLFLHLFWTFFYKIIDPLQGKLWNRKIEFGVFIGASTSLLVVYWFSRAHSFSIAPIYLSAAFLCLMSVIVVSLFASYFPILKTIDESILCLNAHLSYLGILKNNYFRILAFVPFLSGVSIGLVEFVFYSMVSDIYKDSYEIVAYLSLIYTIIIMVGFVISAKYASQIINKYGSKISLLILPFCFLFFGILYIVLSVYYKNSIEEDFFYLLFIVVSSSKILCSILCNGIEIVSIRNYFIPLAMDIRYVFQIQVEVFIRFLGRTIAVGFIFLSYLFSSDKFSTISIVLLLVVICWLLAVLKLHKRYLIMLDKALESESSIQIGDKKSVTLEDKLVATITQLTNDKLPLHLNILSILDPIKYAKSIKVLLYSENSDIQRLALYQAANLCILDAIEVLNKIQKSKFYPISKNRVLVYSTYVKLNSAFIRIEKIKYIEQLTVSKIVDERRFGALLVAYPDTKIRTKIISKLFYDEDYNVRINAIMASSNLPSGYICKYLIDKLSDENYCNAPLSSLIETGISIFPLLEAAFYLPNQKEKVQLKIIKIYKTVAVKESTLFLLKNIYYTNQTIRASVLDALNHCGAIIKGEMAITLRREIEEISSVIVWNISAYLNLKKSNVSSILLEALTEEIKSNYTTLFKFLALVYDSNSIAQIKRHIDTEDSDKKSFAIEFLTVVLVEEMKKIVLPILSSNSYESILENIDDQFIVAPAMLSDILYELIQRDYKYVNGWTKVNALNELIDVGCHEDYDIFIANLHNPDDLIREMASKALYRSPTPLFDSIKVLKAVDVFKDISGVVLAALAKMMKCSRYIKKDRIAVYDSYESFDYYFLVEGSVALSVEEVVVEVYHKGYFIHSLFYRWEKNVELNLWALEDCILYTINKNIFKELMSLYNDIPENILKYSNLKPKGHNVV